MNILRWNRKSNKKIRPKTLLLFIFSLIMTTFAWFAYSKVLEPTLNIHMASWDMTYEIAGQPTANPISIEIPILYPTMDQETIIVDIFNNGETDVDIDYQVKSLTVAGIEYKGVAEGKTTTETNYITIAPSVLETVQTTDVTTGETISTEIFKGAVTNDITRLPFTIDIEHSAQVEAATEDLYGGEDTPGEGYLKVIVNWIGDNDKLDSEWGYKVGEYLASQEEGTPAMTIVLSIDSYQVDPEGTTYETLMPSTSTTRPYLPDGYTRVPGTSLKTGLVIENTNGNQFVWVEVPKSTEVYKTAGIEITEFFEDDSNGAYTKIEADLREYVKEFNTRADGFSDVNAIYNTIGLTESNYTALKYKMLKSIYSHGGFYIGRYETGLESGGRTESSSIDATPVIKANAYPYNFVTCSQANTLASRLKQTGYTTSLMFGIQWDLVMKYLQTNGISQEQDWLKTDSSEWGNYKNNTYTLTNSGAKYNHTANTWATTIPYEKLENSQVLMGSGANSGFCAQNIYDLAGNLSEWTYNIAYDDTLSNYAGGNGGNYTLEGSEASASYYGAYNVRAGAKHVGFRVALISEADMTEEWGDDVTGGSGGSEGGS